MICESKVSESGRDKNTLSISLDGSPREIWDTTDLDYYTEKRLYLISCIHGIKVEYADKVEKSN